MVSAFLRTVEKTRNGRLKREKENESGGFDVACILQTKLLYGLFAHFVLQNFTGGIHREAVDKINIARRFVLGHVGEHKFLELLFRHGFTGLKEMCIRDRYQTGTREYI